MYSICKINNAELLFGPCPSQLIPLNESIKSYVNQGIDVVISLLEEHEQNAIGLEEESLLCEEAGIIFFHFPIVDVSVPSLNRQSQNINTFYEYTLTKNKMFIHCKHGIGRSAMVTASLMIKKWNGFKRIFGYYFIKKRIESSRNHITEEITECILFEIARTINKMNFNLNRYIEAQDRQYAIALAEMKAGYKTNHWMWFIFPQIAGLGFSDISKFYAIKNLEEAKVYLMHEVLGKRLREISKELLMQDTDNATFIFGSTDDMKLHSCMTLFAIADEVNPDNVFEKVLAKFFKSKYDRKTVEILEEQQ